MQYIHGLVISDGDNGIFEDYSPVLTSIGIITTSHQPILYCPCVQFGRAHHYALIPSNGLPSGVRARRVEGCRGPNNCFLKCPSASSSQSHTEVPSSCKESAQRIMGARSVHQLYPALRFGTTLQYGGHDCFNSEVPFGG